MKLKGGETTNEKDNDHCNELILDKLVSTPLIL